LLVDRCPRFSAPPFSVLEHAPAVIDTLSLHDALPIYGGQGSRRLRGLASGRTRRAGAGPRRGRASGARDPNSRRTGHSVLDPARSEEHTSELQSRENLVCRLLLEKKKHKSEHQASVDL